MSPPQEFCRYKIKVFRNLWNKFHIQRVSVWVWNFEQSKIAELIHWAVLRLFCYESDWVCCSHCLSVVVLTLTGRLQAAGTDTERSLTTDNWQQHQHLTSHLVTPRWTDMWRWGTLPVHESSPWARTKQAGVSCVEEGPAVCLLRLT